MPERKPTPGDSNAETLGELLQKYQKRGLNLALMIVNCSKW